MGIAAALGALLITSVEKEARALPLLTLWGSVRGVYGFEAGDTARVGVGTATGSQLKEVNAYGPGIGLAAGVTLPLSLYLGASFDYFFGQTESFGGGVDVSRSSSQLLAHAGYDLGLGPITLRPELGFGYLFGTVTSEVPGSAKSEVSTKGAVLSPGAELFLGLGSLNVNAEARYELVSGDNSNAFLLGLGLGMSL